MSQEEYQNIGKHIEEENNSDAGEQREMKEYDNIENRLKEIEDKVVNNELDLDESLELYEEAVNLGMKASQTIENNVLANMNKSDHHEEGDSE